MRKGKAKVKLEAKSVGVGRTLFDKDVSEAKAINISEPMRVALQAFLASPNEYTLAEAGALLVTAMKFQKTVMGVKGRIFGEVRPR